MFKFFLLITIVIHLFGCRGDLRVSCGKYFGADIYIDNELIGKCQKRARSYELGNGEYELTVSKESKGFLYVYKSNIVISTDETLRVKISEFIGKKLEKAFIEEEIIKPKVYTRFEKLKDMVLDHELKLLWSDTKDSSKYIDSYQDAKDYCEDLNISDYTKWRVPSKIEYEEIIQREKRPSIRGEFRYVSSNYYWTSDIPSNGDFSTAVNFYGGYSLNFDKSSLFNIRCIQTYNKDKN